MNLEDDVVPTEERKKSQKVTPCHQTHTLLLSVSVMLHSAAWNANEFSNRNIFFFVRMTKVDGLFFFYNMPSFI